ncbi:transcriptional regulator [Verrucomicrobia bacterium LW23]|nr:transcriptional regulator [Verrucomicrobia bacterium LW23]
MHDLILFCKALSDPTRVRIVKLLCLTEACVCELCDALEISQSTLSTHLQVIRQAGLVVTRKKGTWIYYSIEPGILGLIETLFAHNQDALRTDRRMETDKQRIQQRITLREAGDCLLGFDVLQPGKEVK